MDQEAAIPIALVLISSYLIAVFVSRKREPTLQGYLFKGNTPLLAISSCLGSMFSLTAAFTALLASGYVFGSQLMPSLALGAGLGVFLLLKISQRPHVGRFLSQSEGKGFSEGASYLAILEELFSGQSYLLYYLLAIVVYASFIATEFAVFRMTLKALAPTLDTPELMLTLIMTFLICYSYVFIGGFKGALITDHFQLGIIVIFLGSLVTQFDLREFVTNLPPMNQGKALSGSILQIVFLHLGSFIGGLAVALVSLDQWYRTLGTLSLVRGRQVLIIGVTLICFLSVIPILIGSYAQNITTFPGDITNYISTLLLQVLLEESNRTVRFLFFMTLAAIVLTTLDTYMLTIQQLYYELSTRLRATTHRTYLLEYALKWNQVRGVGFLIGGFGFLVSMFIGVNAVYLFGVSALALAILLVPLLLIQLFLPPRRLPSWYPATSLIGSGMAYFPAAGWLEKLVGPADVHLYVVAVAAGFATLLVHLVLLLTWRLTYD